MVPMLLIIYGASNDLIEIEGDINEEFNAIDGGVLRIDSDDPEFEQGNLRLSVRPTGPAYSIRRL